MLLTWSSYCVLDIPYLTRYLEAHLADRAVVGTFVIGAVNRSLHDELLCRGTLALAAHVWIVVAVRTRRCQIEHPI